MSNPLVDLHKMMNTRTNKSFRATVVSVNGQEVLVRLNTGNTITVWGSAKINDAVLVVGKSVVAVINNERATTVYVR